MASRIFTLITRPGSGEMESVQKVSGRQPFKFPPPTRGNFSPGPSTCVSTQLHTRIAWCCVVVRVAVTAELLLSPFSMSRMLLLLLLLLILQSSLFCSLPIPPPHESTCQTGIRAIALGAERERVRGTPCMRQCASSATWYTYWWYVQ